MLGPLGPLWALSERDHFPLDLTYCGSPEGGGVEQVLPLPPHNPHPKPVLVSFVFPSYQTYIPIECDQKASQANSLETGR